MKQFSMEVFFGMGIGNYSGKVQPRLQKWFPSDVEKWYSFNLITVAGAEKEGE